LFKGVNPFEKPCGCGRDSRVRLAPEREFDFRTGEVYCLTCLEPPVKKALSQVSAGYVVVQPYRDAPCLVPYQLDELPDLTNWPSRLGELAAGTAQSCHNCGAPARGLSWMVTEEKQSLGAMQDDLRWFDRREAMACCAGCLTGLLLRTLEERDLRLQEVVLPGAGPGVWLPWAY